MFFLVFLIPFGQIGETKYISCQDSLLKLEATKLMHTFKNMISPASARPGKEQKVMPKTGALGTQTLGTKTEALALSLFCFIEALESLSHFRHSI